MTDVVTELAGLQVGPLEVFPASGLARLDGDPLTLSARELGLLVALMRRAGMVVSREELYAEVWGGQLRADDRCVDVYVHKLRAKLDAAAPGRRLIHTHFGFGYRI